MFSDKKNKTSNTSQATGRNIIGSGTTFIGEITSDGDFRIDGAVEGSIQTSGRLIIGKKGKIKGKAKCKNADIEGVFNGELHVDNLLTLKEFANVQGDVSMDKLSVEPGAIFNVNCVMKGAVNLHKNGKGKSEKTA